MNATHCYDCGKPFPTFDAGHIGGTGYANIEESGAEHRICYACADTRIREEMSAAQRMVVYLSSDGKTLTTWSGGELAKVTREHKISGGGFHYGSLTAIQAVAPDGSRWYGRGAGRDMVLVIRRAKSARKEHKA